ncbi:MAG: MoaD/ThiS family protein, partial [bacterium]|nr:MoaD/ThiS family protein [bacterium]
RREVGMRVRIVAFARARDLFGRGECELEVASGATIATVRGALVERAPRLGELGASLRLARNGSVAGEGEPLCEGDEVALLPPVSGG